jgi:hypothetical protein
MLDGFELGVHLFWMAGLALGLLTLVYGAVEAAVRGEKLRARLKLRGYQAIFMGAAALFCMGLGLTARNTWEMILWFALAALFALQAAAALWFTGKNEQN